MVENMKKQMICIDPEAKAADFYHLFYMLRKYSAFKL